MIERLRAWLHRQWWGEGEIEQIEPVGEFKPFDPATSPTEAAAILGDPERLFAEYDTHLARTRERLPRNDV